jgi:ribonucleoside-triphosphate reductase (formate)
MLSHPEKLRFTGFANVTINLPQAAYRGKGDVKKTIEEIEWAMDLAMKSHLQRKRFVGSLMKKGLPLWQIGMPMDILDNEPYVNLDKATYIIGMVGLNECVKRLIGKELHEGDEALKLGLKIIVTMNQKTVKLEKEFGLKVSLEESPAESATYRLAKIDLKCFPEAVNYVMGTKDAPYYTNSIHFNPKAPIDLVTRIVGQSKFHPLIESGAIVHAFTGEANPSASSIYSLIEKVWKETQCSQLTISPSFTACNDCGHVEKGWKE